MFSICKLKTCWNGNKTLYIWKSLVMEYAIAPKYNKWELIARAIFYLLNLIFTTWQKLTTEAYLLEMLQIYLYCVTWTWISRLKIHYHHSLISIDIHIAANKNMLYHRFYTGVIYFYIWVIQFIAKRVITCSELIYWQLKAISMFIALTFIYYKKFLYILFYTGLIRMKIRGIVLLFMVQNFRIPYQCTERYYNQMWQYITNIFSFIIVCPCCLSKTKRKM